jgi:hypothetical protein
MGGILLRSGDRKDENDTTGKEREEGFTVDNLMGRRMVINVHILAAESGGMAGLHIESRHLPVSVVKWDDRDKESM